MNSMRSILCATSMAAAAIALLPGSAAAKGCEAPTTSRVVWLLDGEKVAEFSDTPEDEAEAAAMLPGLRESAWSFGIVCYSAVDSVTGARTAQTALHFVTRAGVPKVAAMFLAEIARAQESHRNSTGLYAPVTYALIFHGLTSAYGVGIRGMTLVGGQDGWTGAIEVAELGISCHVAGGAATLPREGMERGVPKCFTTVEG